jgi:uncharacterized membrane-anchored protein YjiN (DUF445 family)
MTTFQATKKIDEAKHKAALKKMRKLATFLLACMTVLFILSSRLEGTYPIIGILRAFSEAAMVGALADWFAVVALFRHPLNLPIPHTAIIQEHKDRFGENLAVFIRNNFLVRETLDEKLKTIDLTARLGEIFTNPKNIHKIAEKSLEHLLHFLKQFDEQDFKNYSVDLLLKNLQKIKVLPLVRDALTIIFKENKHQALLNEALVMAASILDENKEVIRKKVKQEHPWYIPGPIYEKIFNRIVDQLEEKLSDIQGNPSHEIRKRFDELTGQFINHLEYSKTWAERVDAQGKEFLAHPIFKQHLETLWLDMKIKLMADLLEPDSGSRKHLEKGIFALGNSLMEDQPLRERMNRWIYTLLMDFAEEYADSIISIISDTVKRWDAIKTSRTIELYVGKDLQWIRINGTIVGGLVGLLIYTFSLWFK